MNKKDILKMAEDPRFIPGIYNYCDRWCERCPFTMRCMLYAMDQTEQSFPNARNFIRPGFDTIQNLKNVEE